MAILKTTYPKREFSFVEVQRYSAVLNLVDTITEISDRMDDDTMDLLAIRTDRYFGEDSRGGFDIDGKLDIRSSKMSGNKNNPATKQNQKKTTSHLVADKGNSGNNLDDLDSDDSLHETEASEYTAEINRLRQKLH